MPSDTVKRKLTAILYADVADYSRLTRQDEMTTHQRVMSALDFASDAIGNGGGTVLRYAGDAILAEFQSAVAAAETAVGIQRELAARNADFGADDKVQIRIGLNLGEVIEDRGEIFGDGVNLAARLEAAAQPGGICVGSFVHDQVAGKIGAEFEDGGEHKFKNIDQPVGVYHWHPTETGRTEKPASIATPAHKPSVAVLPFDNMSGDPEQAFFSDGITEDIITDLSRFNTIDVTARNSSFSFRDSGLKINDIARELKVDYVLEGSVRKSGDRIRVTAQLIDGNSEKHVWADRYDRQFEDIFDVQDELTRAIVVALSTQIELEVLERAQRKPPDSMDAYEHVLRGREINIVPDYRRNPQAREHFEKAIELDPKYARAWADLSISYVWEWNFAWSKAPDKSKQRALECAQRAYELNPGEPRALTSLATSLFFAGDLKQSLRLFEQSLKLNPNAAETHRRIGMVLTCQGDQAKAIDHFNRSLELNPMGDPVSEWFIGIANYNEGQYDQAIEAFTSCGVDAPEVFAWLAVAHAQNGQLDQAVAQGERFVQSLREEIEIAGGVVPESCLEFLLERAPYADPGFKEHFAEGARLAGIS